MSPNESPFPRVHELSDYPDPSVVFGRLVGRSHCIFLDSSLRHPVLGRYSFVAADPCERFAGSSSELRWEPLRGRLRQIATPSLEGLPPFQGGLAGVVGYEWSRELEALPLPRHDEFRFPAYWFGLYDVVIAWDHVLRRAWVISQGYPETEPHARGQRAEERLRESLAWLSHAEPVDHVPWSSPIALDAPCHATGHPTLLSNFTPAGYRAAVAEAIARIRAGEVFQVNLSQRLLKPQGASSVAAYLALRARAQATFSAFLDLGTHQVLSISPERFLQLKGDHVEARPIKGTRRNELLPEANLLTQDDLTESQKDRAENTMIVDLWRNDLSRVCADDSLEVAKLCGLESYGYVHHLVSVIRGRLRAGQDAFDLLTAAFPSGSVTGAPKIQSMRMITELEQVARGAYCGAAGYIGGNGNVDLNVLIRTVTCSHGWCQFPVGGGITAKSNPRAEWHETWDKATGILAGLP